MLSALAACNVRHAHLVRCLFGKTRSRHPCAPNAGMRCGLPASSRQCGRCLGWSSTYAEAADTSEPPNASPIPHRRSGFNRSAADDIPCSVPALANANDPDMDDQPKTRLICRRCAARMKLDRLTPHARGVQLQQVEDVEERVGLVAPVAEQLKGSPAFLIATHHLAVDEAGPNLAMVHGLHDENNPAEQTFGFACVDNATLRINPRTPAFR